MPILERALSAARANDQQALATSLECQIAKQVASRDPQRARALLVEALDALLPSAEDDDADQQPPKEESKP